MAHEQSRPIAWHESVLEAEKRGELLSASDLAERGLAEHPGDVWLQHRSVLALARAGSTEEAATRYVAYGLNDIDDEDVAALGARLEKDVALAAHGEERRRHAARAAARYADILDRTGGYYPAVNAATMSLLAGDTSRSRDLARVALAAVERDDEDSYYAAATRAEAQLLLGELASARVALEEARDRHGNDHAALATTRRQLRLVCESAELDTGVLDVLAGPLVAHFCGHRITPANAAGRFTASAEAAVKEAMLAVVARRPVAYAYGALASGADIMWAEALLDHDAELHVVLPFDREEFVRSSVQDGGPSWIRRFERCLDAASAVTYATDDAFLGDDVLFRYGTELAMGLAILRARWLDADVEQLALWDGEPAAAAAGTALDVAAWRGTGQPATVLSPSGRHVDPPDPGLGPQVSRPGGRVVRSMLFADVKGFSKLTDEQLPRFAEHVLGGFRRTLDAHRESVLHSNTWGDAIYVVLTDVVTAARCALDLQDTMAAIDLPAAGLPEHLELRLGAHVGPVFPIHDPVIDLPAFMGSHVSRTARIEPITPPGTVYVTEPFAAALALAGRDDLPCDYVGHMPAAKDFGRLRMYRLRRLARGGASRCSRAL